MRLLFAFLTNVLMAGTLSATPLTYTFTGTGSGTLNGTPFTNQTLTFSLAGDSSLVQHDCQTGCFIGSLETGFFSLSGVGQFPLTFENDIFVMGTNQFISLSLSTTTPVFVTNPLLSTYDLRSATGPITSTTPWGPSGGTIIQTPGDLIITSPVTYTFTATTVPEPSSLTLTLIGVGGLIHAGLRRKWRLTPA